MKRKLLTPRLKTALAAVPAAALMLGASQAQTTVGINFWGAFGTYGYGGAPVTATAFGVDATNWFTTPASDYQTAANGDLTAGSLSVNWSAPNTWISSLEGDTNSPAGAWNSPLPGDPEVLWGYLDDGNGVFQAPAATISGLSTVFPHGYVIQTIAAEDANPMTFANVNVNDGVTADVLTYPYIWHPYDWSGPVDGAAKGTAGLSFKSVEFTGDVLSLQCDLKGTTGTRSVLCGFIITDQPIVTRSATNDVVVASSTPLILPPASIIGVGLTYQWRLNGTNIPGATFASYTNNSAAATDNGVYDVVAASSFYPSMIVTGAVASVTVVPPHVSTWDADTATTGAQDGSGTWTYAGMNWWVDSMDYNWNAIDSAIFGVGGAGPYTVTLGTNIVANALTFASGGYTLTNAAGETLTLQGTNTITANADATISVPLSTGTNTFTKAGAGALTLVGSFTSAKTVVNAGTLEVQSKSGDSSYVVTNGATLKIGYSTGGGYAATGLQLYGDGTAATSGLYLKGGTSYNVSGGVVINGAPTTIRTYGTGVASFNIFDIGSNPGLSTTAAASGSIVDSNIQMVRGGYGMVITTTPGANTTTGDLILNGPLNIDFNSFSGGLNKKGTGSLRLNAMATSTNSGLRLLAGSVICGTNDCVGTNAFLDVRAGATFDLNGYSQSVSNAALNGTLRMSLNKGGTPNSTVLTCWGNTLSLGGSLVVTNLGAAPALGESYTLFNAPLGLAGTFTTVTLPTLANGLAWEDDLAVDGTLKVITGSTPPSIVTNLPTSLYAYAGSSRTLTVVATGDPVLHYVWKKNGTIPVGTDSPSLVLSSLTAADDADYSVTVTNNYGPAPSVTCHLTVATPGVAASAAVQDGPQSLWPLSEAAPSTAYDYLGEHDGLQGGALTLGVAGPRPPAYQGFSAGKTAYLFDGATAFIDCGTGPSLSGTTDFTLEAWIQTTNTVTSGVILQQRDADGYNGEYQLLVNPNGTLHLLVYGNNTTQVDFNSSITSKFVNDGAWHHVAAVRAGTTCTLYIDGALVGSATGTLVPLLNTIKTVIGADIRNNNTFFNGAMADVAVYNSALAAARIADHAVKGVLANNPLVLSQVAGGLIEDSKPAGTPHPGFNYGTAWLSSSTDANSVLRSGVQQFVNGRQLVIPPSPDFDTTNGTIMFWVRANAPLPGPGTEAAMLVDHRTTGAGAKGTVIVLADGGGIKVQCAGTANNFTGGYVADGNWHHVAVAYDQAAGGSITLYVDGVNNGANPNTAAWSWPTNKQIELGRSHDNYWRALDGQMDDFRIYNRILNDSEVASVFSSDAIVDTNALQVRYNFGNATGVGQSFSWPVGQLQATPTLAPAAWAPVRSGNTSAAWRLPSGVPTTTNSALFYRVGF